MRYGYYLPTRGPLSEPDAIGEMVGQGESMGFATIVIADHIVFPTEVNSPYPYTVDGGFPGQGDALEQLSLMSYVAALTTTSRLVTSVMILPHRNPVMTAKMLATIDVLSKRASPSALVSAGSVRSSKRCTRLISTSGEPSATSISRSSRNVGPRTRSLSKVSSILSRNCAAYRTRCKTRIRRSGLAVTASLPCAALRSMRTVGTPWGRPLPHPCRRPSSKN